MSFLDLTARSGEAFQDDAAELNVTVSEMEPLTYGALTTAAMGNLAPAEVVAANANRRGLIVTNISDTTGYLSIGDGTGLTTTTYLFQLATGETLIFSPPISQQAIAAVCGAAAKNVAYQEAT